MNWLLRLRAKLAWIWRVGLIDRTTAFQWEMEAARVEALMQAAPRGRRNQTR